MLYYTSKLTCVKEFVGALSVLSGAGDVCAQCSIRQEACVEFELAGSHS